MDRISLKTMEEKPGMPEYLKTLSPTATALLVEVRGVDTESLEQKIKSVDELLKEIPTVLPISFTAVKAEYDNLWNIRKGIFPVVGAIRPLGTGVVIEDVAFPKENLAHHMTGVTGIMRFGLGAVNGVHHILGTSVMGGLTQGARKISRNTIPLWNPWMPRAGKFPVLKPKEHSVERTSTNGSSPMKVVYFPSCISRSMGAAKDDLDQRSLSEAMLSVLAKSGYDVIIPPKMNGLCCGMPWESKGFFETADKKSSELEKVLFAASEGGKYPILCDTSPCLYRMKRVMLSLKLYEPVEFIYDLLLNRLTFNQIHGPVAVHVTCSSIKMNLKDKFYAVTHACAENVVMPKDVHCCGFAGDRGFTVPELNSSALASLKDDLPKDCHAGYSNSRTCEIGLSLHSGISYQSIIYLVDKCTKSKI